jgi:GNAT superfamily N-acetyltransferase
MHKNSVTTLVSKLITAEETFPVRHAVLRKGRPIETCAFEGDDLATTFHLGGFVDDKLVAIASFFKAEHKEYQFKNAYQLRGMAVLESHHHFGYGKQLLEFGEKLLLDKQVETIWMNARIVAIGFYTKLNYKTIGTVFDIPMVGEHYVMFKNI